MWPKSDQFSLYLVVLLVKLSVTDRSFVIADINGTLEYGHMFPPEWAEAVFGHKEKVDQLIDSATAISPVTRLPETLYQQMNRIVSKSSTSREEPESKLTVNMSPGSRAIKFDGKVTTANPIRPTDGSDVDLRDLLKKEFDEKSNSRAMPTSNGLNIFSVIPLDHQATNHQPGIASSDRRQVPPPKVLSPTVTIRKSSTNGHSHAPQSGVSLVVINPELRGQPGSPHVVHVDPPQETVIYHPGPTRKPYVYHKTVSSGQRPVTPPSRPVSSTAGNTRYVATATEMTVKIVPTPSSTTTGPQLQSTVSSADRNFRNKLVNPTSQYDEFLKKLNATLLNKFSQPSSTTTTSSPAPEVILFENITASTAKPVDHEKIDLKADSEEKEQDYDNIADGSVGIRTSERGKLPADHDGGEGGDQEVYTGQNEPESYKLTTERLAYILIGSCCALSIICLIIVAFSIRCRDMCDEYKAWKKAEKLAVYGNYRHGHGRRPRPPVGQRLTEEPFYRNIGENNSNYPQISAISRPIFGPSCCCNSQWSMQRPESSSCPRGYFHPCPRGKLPFGAASSVHTVFPRHITAANNVTFSEEEDDSLVTSVIINDDHSHPPAPVSRYPGGPHRVVIGGGGGEPHCTCDMDQGPSANSGQKTVHSHVTRAKVGHSHSTSSTSPPVKVITHSKQPQGPSNNSKGHNNHPTSWVQSSIIVNELHRRHSSIIDHERSAGPSTAHPYANNVHSNHDGQQQHGHNGGGGHNHHGGHGRPLSQEEKRLIFWSANEDRLI
ncbi:hypothetical protein HDE_04994 [Halotydeus destructor]|nr:hypothetical protein HDE_04994 [Halotydeus destructor]